MKKQWPKSYQKRYERLTVIYRDYDSSCRRNQLLNWAFVERGKWKTIRVDFLPSVGGVGEPEIVPLSIAFPNGVNTTETSLRQSGRVWDSSRVNRAHRSRMPAASPGRKAEYAPVMHRLSKKTPLRRFARPARVAKTCRT